MPKVSSNSISDDKVEFTVEIVKDELKPYLEKAAGKLSTDKPPHGWRPGKVDVKNAEKIYGAMALYETALDFVVRKTLPKAIEDKKITFVGQPDIAVIKCSPGNPIIYKATLSLMPRVTLGDYAKIKVEKKPVTVDDKQVEETVMHIRESRAQEVAVDRPVKKGDRISLDFFFYLDGVSLEGGTMKNQQLIVGKNEDVWPGMSEQLTGMSRGNTKEFSLTLPKTFWQKNIAGKTVDVKVTIHDVFERTVPALDDAFAASLGSFKTAEELTKRIKENLLREAEEREKQRVEGEVLRALVSTAVFTAIPDSMVSEEQKRMLTEQKHMVTQQGLKWDDYLGHLKKTEEEIEEGMKDAARERIKNHIALAELIKQKGITAHDDEVTAEWEKMKRGNQEFAKIETTHPERVQAFLRHIKTMLLHKKALKEAVRETAG